MDKLKNDIHEFQSSLKEEENFYTEKTGGDDGTGSITWDVHYVENLPKLYKDITSIVGRIEKVHNKINTDQSKHLLKLIRSLQNRFSRLAKKYKDLKEQSSTAQGGANMSGGNGSQIATPKAFKKKGKSSNIYDGNSGYTKVPNKIKGSGLEVKNLFENESQDFQNERTEIFSEIEEELNSLSPLISNAKNKTTEYYSQNPGSYAIVISTDLILEYVKDIKLLLKGEE